MRLAYHTQIYLFILLTWVEDLTAAKKSQCPIGFNIGYTESEKPICYRQKGPEMFTDKFKDCIGNLYTAKLYHSMRLRTNKVLWTDYKSLYPGAPFIDQSYTESSGSLLASPSFSSFDVKYDSSLGLDEELCVVIDPVSNFTATRCNEKHYRFCFVEPYPEEEDMSRKGCTEFRGSWRFFSPSANCLVPVTGVGGGTVRATWRQAQELCGKRGGSLLNKGWRYSNNPLLHTSGAQPMYPMGIVMNSDHDMLRYDAENDKDEIPDWDWHFSSTSDAPDAVYGAVRNEFWTLVNSSYIFFDVVCEAPTVIRNINMNLTVDGEKKIILKVNDTIKKSDILCLSDTLIYRSIYGSPASSTHISRSETNDNEFYLDNDYNGYYWCIQFDYNNYHVSESNRALYVNPKDAANLYACKIRVKKAYTFENLEKQLKIWRKKLEELIYYRTKYISVYGGMNTTDHFEAERVLKAFKNAKPELDWKDSEVITDISIRRLFLDRRTVLLHVSINPKMHPLLAAIWEGIQVIDWKPAYFCERFGRIPRLKLGDFIKYKCGLFKCIGNFNEGVQWVETAISGCVPSSTEMVQTVQLLNDTFVATDKPLSTDKDYEQIRTQGASEATNGTSPPAIIPTPVPVTPDGTQVIFVDSPPEVSTVNAPPGITTPDPTVVSTVSSPTDMPTDVITVTSSTDEPTDVVTVTSPPDESSTPTDPDVSTVTSPPGESSTDDSSSEETTTPDIVTTPVPKVEEQIQLVLQDLENLLLNDSIPIESITTTFDQVNEILEIEEDGVDIPGQLLHMLDELGTRVELNGQPTAKTVRQNIALLLADVTPDNPVRGMRVAARETDQFGNDTFSFIDRAVDSEALLASTTEALVYLPPSVIRTPRRVSFVAFRNQQAFRSDVAVNSRIFSVNVENITHFENGERGLREYSWRFERKLNETDVPINITSLQEIVRQMNSFLNTLGNSTFFYDVLYKAILQVDMEGQSYEVFRDGKVMIILVDATPEFVVSGYLIKAPSSLSNPCRAPESDQVELITGRQTLEDSVSNSSDLFVYKTSPIQQRTYFFIIVNDSSEGCRIRTTFPLDEPHDEESDEDQSEDSTTQPEVVINRDVQKVLDDLELLLQNDSIVMSSKEVHNTIDQVDTLLVQERNDTLPGHLLQLLDELGARVKLEGMPTGVAVAENFALLAADSGPNHLVRGIRIQAQGNNRYSNDSFRFINDTIDTIPLTNGTEAEVYLPDAVTQGSRRVSFVVFRNDRAFHHTEDCKINSKIISVNVENITKLENGEVVKLYLSPFTKRHRRDEKRVCAYWHFLANGSGYWSQTGCFFIKAANKGSLDACYCDHLTHFAQILVKKEVFAEIHEKVLEIISIVGCSFSVFGILIIILTAALFKSWRRNESNQIWLQLCIAVFILDVCFIVAVCVEFTTYDIGCVVVGVGLHFSTLATFSWMTVVSILSYRKLVIVFARDIRRKVLIASCFAWGLPCLVIIILLSVNVHSYSGKFEEKSPNGNFCYPSGLAMWLTIFFPISAMWFVNWTLYALITKSMYIDKKIRKHSGTTETLQNASASCLLAFLCGVPWGFGFFAYNIVAAYLFALTVSFQGFVLFVFFVLAAPKTRQLWINMFKGRRSRWTYDWSDSGVSRKSYFRSSRRSNVRSSKKSNVTAKFYVPGSLSSEEPSSELLSEGRINLQSEQ